MALRKAYHPPFFFTASIKLLTSPGVRWSREELLEHWTLLPRELALLTQKKKPNRLGFAIILKFYQYEGQFPSNKREIPHQVIGYVADQLKVDPQQFDGYDFEGRTIKVHRVAIRDFLGFHEATLSEQKSLKTWLEKQVLAYDLKTDSLIIAAKTHLRSLSIEPPTAEQLEKLVRSTIHQFEEKLFKSLSQKLPVTTRKKLDKLLFPSSDDNPKQTAQKAEQFEGNKDEYESSKNQTHPQQKSLLTILKSDPGRLGLDSWIGEAEKLQQLRELGLPPKWEDRITFSIS